MEISTWNMIGNNQYKLLNNPLFSLFILTYTGTRNEELSWQIEEIIE